MPRLWSLAKRLSTKNTSNMECYVLSTVIALNYMSKEVIVRLEQVKKMGYHSARVAMQ